MRIIGGNFRGRKLGAIGRGFLIRPTADRIRESIFNIVGKQAAGTAVLDLYAGTGALGIEALSRGATSAVFIDNSRQALSLIAKSLDMLAIEHKAKLIKWDIGKNLNCIRSPKAIPAPASKALPPGTQTMGFGLVFVDPPYGCGHVEIALSHLQHSKAISADTWIVVEHSISEPIANESESYRVEKRKIYGKTSVTFLKLK